MELHIQKCQSCGSRNLRNILVRDEAQKVFVQCRECDELVARYVLAVGGYYHAGKAFESFLRSLERDGGASSGKDLQTLFDQTLSSTVKEFEDVKDLMHDRYADGIP